MPEVFAQCDITLDQVALIKTSTSGNDAGAVLSLGDSLCEMNPVFYIETDMSMTADRAVLDSQLDAYLQMDDFLRLMIMRFALSSTILATCYAKARPKP